jgi:hypothetical protein
MALEALKRNGHNLHIGEFETDGRYNIPVLKPILLEHRLHWLPFNCARTDKAAAPTASHSSWTITSSSGCGTTRRAMRSCFPTSTRS